MVVRVRVRIARGSRVVETSAIANSGYEAETPQVLIPKRLAGELGLWPPPPGTVETVFDTAGGPLHAWVTPRACRVKVVAGDAESPEVLVDSVVSTIADEVLLSDKTISKLQVALEDVGEGLWRFRWEPSEKTRRSEPPETWR